MKHLKSIIAAALTMFVALAVSVTAFAAESGTITINVPENTTTETTYSVYKVFDATVNDDDATKVSYTLPAGKTLSGDMLTYFSVDSAGNVTVLDAAKGSDGKLTEGAIKAIAKFVENDSPVTTVKAPAGAKTVTTDAIGFGYYYISTTTGSVVTIDTNNANPTVDDKNTLTVVVKSAGTKYDAESLKAIAAVGTEQDFTAQITVGNGATSLVFTDTMTNMTYVADSLVVKNGQKTLVANTDYTLSVAEGSGSFTVTFQNVPTALKSGDVITLNYKGLVTSDALSKDPANNKATITTDNGNTSESETVKVYNAKFTVTKYQPAKEGDAGATTVDGKLVKPLAGAGFVIKNAAGKYYKLADDKKSIEWVDDIKNATEYTSDDQGAVPAFTGLADGTYTLVEKTVPAGYNKAADKDFTIKDGDYTATNLEQAANVTNESGTELPSTGGMGTTLFYIVGGLMVAGAAIALIAKNRVAKMEA